MASLFIQSSFGVWALSSVDSGLVLKIPAGTGLSNTSAHYRGCGGHQCRGLLCLCLFLFPFHFHCVCGTAAADVAAATQNEINVGLLTDDLFAWAG